MPSTKERILAEATRQLTSIGYAGFTVAGVREALGLSSGSMFHAFSSKAALAAAVYVGGMADYQRAVTHAITRAPDPERALRAWIATDAAWIEDHRDLARYMFTTLPDEVMAEATAALAEHNASFYAALTSLSERAAAAGLMGPMEPLLAQAFCIGPSHEYARKWTRERAATPPRKLVRKFQAAVLAALATTAIADAYPTTTEETRV